MTSPVRPGDRIADKYRVEGVLGTGGMGVVVAAVHEALDQRVAIKFLLPDVLARPEIVERFLREARAAVRIRSEHIARVLDVGTLPTGAPYMVMELLEGEDLEQMIARRGAIAWQEAVGFVLEACEALAEAHALGIIHRDLKPANLFLARGPSGTLVKVLDFGISKIPLTAKEQALTQESAIVGSPSYMSPEQVRASRDVDARSDVYSLGVVLYQLLTGHTPFSATTMAALVALVLLERPAPITPVRPDVPPGLDAVIARCLEKAPGSRYADIVALSGALLPYGPARSVQSVERIEHAMGRSSADRTFDPTLMPSTTGSSSASLAAGHPRRPGSSNAKLWGFGFAVALLGGALALALVRPVRSSAAVAATSSEPAPSVQAPSAAPSASVAVAPNDGRATATSSAHPPASAEPEPAATATAGKPLLVASHAAGKASAAPCKVVSFFDAEGNKHFKQDCK